MTGCVRKWSKMSVATFSLAVRSSRRRTTRLGTRWQHRTSVNSHGPPRTKNDLFLHGNDQNTEWPCGLVCVIETSW
jgi:hypothetical protein